MAVDREALRESARLSLAKKTEVEKKASRDRLFYVLMGKKSVKTAGEKSEWGRLPDDYDTGIEVKAAWKRKTSEERQASLDRLDAELGKKGADAIKKAFKKAFQYVQETKESERIANEAT